MQKILKNHFKLFLAILAIIIFYPTLSGGAFFDDNSFIFSNKGLISAPNPFVFFQKESGFYRSWPLGYSILWYCYQVFKTNFIFYKVLNLTIHLLNTYLILYILKNHKLKYAITTIFLIHPLQVETISWIFQLKTLLSVFFGLLSYIFLIKYKDKNKLMLFFLSCFFFYLSLISKITLIFLPFILFHFIKSNKFRFFIILPYFALSLLVGLDTLKGVRINEAEKTAKKEYYEEDTETITSLLNYEDNEVLNTKSKISSLLKISLRPIYNLNNYLKKFIFPYNLSLTYSKKDSLSLLTKLFSILVFCILIFYFIKSDITHITKASNLILIHLLILFPILGYVYVPYMKFTYIADHWFYPGVFTALLFISHYFKEKIRTPIVACFALYFAGYSHHLSKIYSDNYKLLQRSISIAPQDFGPLLTLTEASIAKKEFKVALERLNKVNKPIKDIPIHYYFLKTSIYREIRDYKNLQLTLNDMSKKYLYLGDFKNARLYLRESLNLNQDQPEIKFLLEYIKSLKV